MKTKRTNPDFLNGVPELLILSLLSRRSMYGYELVQAIRQSTRGTLEFGEGCVYPILHRLEAEGLLASKRETVGGPQPRGLSGHGERLETAFQHRDRLATDRAGDRSCFARRRTWRTRLGLMKCGSGLQSMPCRRRIFGDSWKNCPIIFKISRRKT